MAALVVLVLVINFVTMPAEEYRGDAEAVRVETGYTQWEEERELFTMNIFPALWGYFISQQGSLFLQRQFNEFFRSPG